MKIYQVKIIKLYGFHPYSSQNDVEILKETYFSTTEKAKKHLTDIGFICSPTLIFCGNKVIRICKNLEEANSFLNEARPTILQNMLTIDTPFHENVWVLPDSILNYDFDPYKGTHALLNEIEVI